MDKKARMKYLFSIGLLVALFTGTEAQPSIQWQRGFGGSQPDEATTIRLTSDSCYFVAGFALSNNGNITGNKGITDFWVIKLNSAGDLLWQKSLGGTNDDRCYSASPTTDGGYILVGETSSNNLNVSGNHGDVDCWVVKLDPNGNIQWQKCLGGSYWDEASCVQQTTDGGYIVVGRAGSTDGDITGHHGSFDFWAVKLNSNGQIIWQNALGGSLLDIAYSVKQTLDGGYILVGESNSTNGDCSGLHGSTDLWVVKLTPEGNLEWQKMLGSTSLDWAVDVLVETNGGYTILGQITWNDGDVSERFGGFDIWVVNIDGSGNLVWERTFGGSKEEYARSIIQKENGYIVVGVTQSVDGQVVGNDGGADLWLFKIDSLGNLLWQKTLGGSQDDLGHSVIQTLDGGLALAGYARSNNGDVSGNHGSTDYWIVKLAPETSTTQTPAAIPLNLYPNPANQWITLNLPIIEHMQVSITDEQGRLLLSRTIRTDEKLDIAALPPGIYWVSAVSKSGQVYAGKFVKN
ncbi:MAG: T9SS type A sorting domain-containing protein [Chitinophagales bacterium]|nr:T9SS type A sorting domain-containing protein [Chitinophagales bacterium]